VVEVADRLRGLVILQGRSVSPPTCSNFKAPIGAGVEEIRRRTLSCVGLVTKVLSWMVFRISQVVYNYPINGTISARKSMLIACVGVVTKFLNKVIYNYLISGTMSTRYKFYSALSLPLNYCHAIKLKFPGRVSCAMVMCGSEPAAT